VAKAAILVVEDDRDIQELVAYNLSLEGFQVWRASTGEEGLQMARERRPDLIVLDLMLPGMDGLEVCRRIRRNEETEEIPIVMLTAKTEDVDIITGLEIGADDYVTKPFSPLEIHLGRHEVRIDGNSITLTLTEFRILQLLASRPGWVYSREQIVSHVRGTGYPVTERAVDVQIVGLRKKLGKFGDRIVTVRGIGYKLADDS